MVLGQDVLGGVGKNDRDRRFFEQREEKRRAVGDVDGVARDENRPAGAPKKPGDFPDFGRKVMASVPRLLESRQRLGIDVRRLDIERYLDPDGPGASARLEDALSRTARICSGLRTHSAYFVTGRAISGTSPSCGPSCRMPEGGRGSVSAHLAEMTTTGSESIHAPRMPASALARTERDEADAQAADSRVPFRADRARLLVLVAVVAKVGVAPDGVEQVHDSAARDKEDVPRAPAREEVRDVIGKLHRPAAAGTFALQRRR
jgi:hypothetical protein